LSNPADRQTDRQTDRQSRVKMWAEINTNRRERR